MLFFTVDGSAKNYRLRHAIVDFFKCNHFKIIILITFKEPYLNFAFRRVTTDHYPSLPGESDQFSEYCVIAGLPKRARSTTTSVCLFVHVNPWPRDSPIAFSSSSFFFHNATPPPHLLSAPSCASCHPYLPFNSHLYRSKTTKQT